MEAIRVRSAVVRDGEIRVTGLPCHKGEDIEVILFMNSSESNPKRQLTARKLRSADVCGIWRQRSDLGDSSAFARGLREKSQSRL
ncbi:MAG: hypothetical protein WCP86_04010 [bacterium]